MPKVIIPLAQGFEEIEAVTLIDIMRRAGIEVTVAGITEGNITGSHKIQITPDTELSTIQAENYDSIVLPGGQPGSDNLAKDPTLLTLLQEFNRKQKITAAVCAAPIVLAKAGLLENKQVTVYPGYEQVLGNVHFSTDSVVTDGTVITSRGPGTAASLAFTIVEHLVGKEKSEQLRKTMLYTQHI